MAQFHFVEDYERLVARYLAQYPIDEAMSRAVGGGIGDYEAAGEVELDVVRWAGLKDGMSIVDLGCGSGRLAHAIGRNMSVDFLGVDIVQRLLDYAKTKSPPNFRFVCNYTTRIPAENDSVDMVSAFSLFTHLLHAETYLYLEDARRVLHTGGKIVFSFLEFSDPAHWDSFLGEVANRRSSGGRAPLNTTNKRSGIAYWAHALRYHPLRYKVESIAAGARRLLGAKGKHSALPLNTMIERNAIYCWADALGYEVESIVGGAQAPWGGLALWQSVCVLQK